MMADKDAVIQALRATLISVKGALTIKQCNRDYRELQGEFIPFRKLGYSSLEQLFHDVPGFKTRQTNGEWYVDAIASQETQHIAAMVARQKTAKKSYSKSYSRFPKKQVPWRKPMPSSSYSSNYNSQYSNQYYRAKSGISFDNNNSYNKFNNKYTNKTSENRYNCKATTKPNEHPDYVEKSVSNLPATVPNKNLNGQGVKEVKNTHHEEHKHSTNTDSTTEVKKSGKISASQRLSKLRDHLNTVDLIPLHLPAATNECLEDNGPLSHGVPAHNLEPPPDSTSSVVKLEWTCRKLGLPMPIFKVHDIRPKRGPVSYDCTVKVGTTYTASSYPDSSPSEELAKEVASVKILAVIESSEACGLPTSPPARAAAALAELVAEHEAGLWAGTVPHLYRERCGENLPNNWQELVEKCPRIKTDKVVNGLLVLLPNTEEPISPYIRNVIDDTSYDSDLPPLQFPDIDFWNVFVTVANSTLEIWLRIIGPQYSGAFETLLADMAKYYENSGSLVEKSMLLKDAWYVVNLEDGGWQRAKVLEIEDNTATVFLGDHGDVDVVSLNKIKILEPQFRRLPAQAILCRLQDAEELAASELSAELVRRRLPGEVLVAAPGPRHDPDDPSVAVVLYDTSTPRDLNLNLEIVRDFCVAGGFNLSQKPCEVEVGCVTEEGRVWVARAGGSALVRDALAMLTSGPYRRALPAAPAAPPAAPHALYIVRTLRGDWVRCSVISGLDGEGTVRTQLVDSGLILRAPLSSLVPLQAFSPALHDFPAQAVQVRLASAERAASHMVPRLRELLLDTRVLCRAAGPAPAAAPAGTAPAGSAPAGSAPAVELFVRTGEQNILASVNNSINLEYEYLQLGKPKEETEKEPESTVEALNRKKERIFRSTSSSNSLGGREAGAGSAGGAGGAGGDLFKGGALPQPLLPSIGQCLDVYIAMAANPWNFVIQANSTRHTLQAMMETLQEECPKINPSEAPTSPASGELYAVFYEKDSSWYRVTVAGVVSSEMVSVYFCDFGDLALFPSAALRPLPPRAAAARTLPPQAVKAKLYDVYPLHQDWTVEDCIRFQELCVEQQFVAVCKEVGRDPLNPSEPLLTLDLIDTSTDQDIYLGKQLVAEGRARLGADA